ncbi:MAG TPA: hypothetical protein PLO41_01885 [Rubrivivax sp.]|nr:hypothetical protein [Rubrivivax sp.]
MHVDPQHVRQRFEVGAGGGRPPHQLARRIGKERSLGEFDLLVEAVIDLDAQALVGHRVDQRRIDEQQKAQADCITDRQAGAQAQPAPRRDR